MKPRSWDETLQLAAKHPEHKRQIMAILRPLEQEFDRLDRRLDNPFYFIWLVWTFQMFKTRRRWLELLDKITDLKIQLLDTQVPYEIVMQVACDAITIDHILPKPNENE